MSFNVLIYTFIVIVLLDCCQKKIFFFPWQHRVPIEGAAWGYMRCTSRFSSKTAKGCESAKATWFRRTKIDLWSKHWCEAISNRDNFQLVGVNWCRSTYRCEAILINIKLQRKCYTGYQLLLGVRKGKCRKKIVNRKCISFLGYLFLVGRFTIACLSSKYFQDVADYILPYLHLVATQI